MGGKRKKVFFSHGVGTRLRFLRKKMNLHQKQFCVFLGVSQSQYSKIERGTQEVKGDMIDKISKALEIPAVWFWDDGELH